MFSMHKAFKKISLWRSKDDGVVAVEFAMVGTLFLTVLVGIYAVGVYFFTWNRLEYGTQTAARYAAVHDDATLSDLEDIVLDSLTVVSGSPDDLTVTLSTTTQNGINFAEVTSNYQFTWVLPFLPDDFNNILLTSNARTPVN